VSDNRPNTMITNILVNEESLPNRNKIYLDNDANNIRIEYLSIHFKSRGNVKYRYKLEGLDREWIYTTDLIASYPFLPSGDYVFIVEAANESGIWSKKTARISIHVNSAYWAKWWFYTIISFFILGGLFALYRIRFRTRAQKEKIQREMNQYRQMALTRQMNPHFIFNSLNAIQLYILQNDTRLSNKFLTKFSKLIRLILENSQTTLISLEKELLTLNLYLELESLRFKEKMEYAIDIQDEIDTLGVKIPPMIIQPFVENAIWHGLMNKNDQTTGQLGIIFSLEDENIICRIEDNGVGRAKAKEINTEKNNTHKSMGTTITQDRIELINSIYKTNISVEYIDLFDDKQESKGTVVKITFTY
jgi:anti-sigma regulatory factor (Ser/Thr protein kinase)